VNLKTHGISKAGKICLRRSSFALCPKCNKVVDLMEYDRAAEVFHTDAQDIKYLAGRGDVHRVHNRKGVVMVCSISLFECFEARRTRLLDSHFVTDVGSAGEISVIAGDTKP
jgi:hypothetical protein